MSLLEQRPTTTPELYKTEYLEEITERHDARRVFDELVARQELEFEKHQQWAEKSVDERAESWMLSKVEAYRESVTTGYGEFDINWNLDDPFHQKSFQLFHDILGLSWEGMDEELRLMEIDNGIGLFGRASFHMNDSGEKTYQCVWYETRPVDTVGGFALRISQADAQQKVI